MRGHNTNNNDARKFSQKSHLRGKSAISTHNNINNNDDSTILLPKSKDGTTAQDTIYLCNFRVSVDGEWLCLKELQDGMQSNEGAPVEESKSIHVANDKCREKIVEQDWVNYYCRCFFSILVPSSFSVANVFFSPDSKSIISHITYFITQTQPLNIPDIFSLIFDNKKPHSLRRPHQTVSTTIILVCLPEI